MEYATFQKYINMSNFLKFPILSITIKYTIIILRFNLIIHITEQITYISDINITLYIGYYRALAEYVLFFSGCII